MPSTFPPLSPWEGRGLGRLTVMVRRTVRKFPANSGCRASAEQKYSWAGAEAVCLDVGCRLGTLFRARERPTYSIGRSERPEKPKPPRGRRAAMTPPADLEPWV
jgi:hypothetical protein